MKEIDEAIKDLENCHRVYIETRDIALAALRTLKEMEENDIAEISTEYWLDRFNEYLKGE